MSYSIEMLATLCGRPGSGGKGCWLLTEDVDRWRYVVFWRVLSSGECPVHRDRQGQSMNQNVLHIPEDGQSFPEQEFLLDG
jgi:hypothetical protein